MQEYRLIRDDDADARLSPKSTRATGGREFAETQVVRLVNDAFFYVTN